MTSLPLLEESIHRQLIDRREKLQGVIRTAGERAELAGLLRQVDAALARFDAGTFGICEVCHGTVESDRLTANPLLSYCLDCLDDSQRQSLQMDLERAASIQAGLLPPRDLSLSGWEMHYHYEPAGPVSGDFVDVIPPASARDDAFFLLGDVSGKGVSASLLMSHLQAIFRGVARAEVPLPEIAAAANRMFCDSTLPGHFATAVCARAGSSGTVELLNAGHSPSLLLAGGEVRTLPAEGLPMGLFCEGSYRARSLQLAPGDALVLVSDGLLEARNAEEVEYGLQRAVSLLAGHRRASAEEMVRAYVEDVGAHREDHAERDDLTILAIRRLG